MKTRMMGWVMVIAGGMLAGSGTTAEAQFRFKRFKVRNPVRRFTPKPTISTRIIRNGGRGIVPKRYQINGPKSWKRVQKRHFSNGRFPIFGGTTRTGGFQPGQRPNFERRNRKPVNVQVQERPRRQGEGRKINGNYGYYWSDSEEIRQRRNRDREFRGNGNGRYGNGGGGGNYKTFYLNGRRTYRPSTRRQSSTRSSTRRRGHRPLNLMHGVLR